MLQICRCSCEKNLKTVVGSGKPFELCFLSQWILKVQPCGSENILYFIWKWRKWPGIWWKTHVLVGWPPLHSSISLIYEAAVEEGDRSSSPAREASLWRTAMPLAVFPCTSWRLISWILGAWTWHLSPSLPLLPLCLSCAMRLVMVEVEAQQRPY